MNIIETRNRLERQHSIVSWSCMACFVIGGVTVVTSPIIGILNDSLSLMLYLFIIGFFLCLIGHILNGFAKDTAEKIMETFDDGLSFDRVSVEDLSPEDSYLVGIPDEHSENVMWCYGCYHPIKNEFFVLFDDVWDPLEDLNNAIILKLPKVFGDINFNSDGVP